jgi:hypothetical protein
MKPLSDEEIENIWERHNAFGLAEIKSMARDLRRCREALKKIRAGCGDPGSVAYEALGEDDG